MTTVRIWQSEDKTKAFEACGHAGYARRGIDIVCSAITTLITTTINSIEKLCEEKTDVTVDEKIGMIRCVFKDTPSERSQLLVDSMILGLKQIQEEYGNKYIDIIFEEV